MSATTLELKIPVRTSSVQPAQMQRTVVRHLLHDGQVTMPDALAMLSTEDQAWLIKALLQDAQESLFLAGHITEPAWQQRFWQQYNARLGNLLYWHEHWSTSHNHLLAILRTVVRRYTLEVLTPEQIELLQRLTLRLQEKLLSREDIFAVMQALQDVGLNTLFDLSPIADSLFQSYVAELGRA
jgi:hypothetical protein